MVHTVLLLLPKRSRVLREIKFRAYNKKTGQMKQVFSLIDLHHCSARVEVDKTTLEEWPLDDVELMQSTGQRDKDGREIYEGDIIADGHNYNKCSVSMDWAGGMADECIYGWIFGTRDVRPEDLYVIGNIYQNPELLR